MTTTAETPAISDEEIRDWARSTGRKVGERGRVSPSLRSEYEGLRAGLHGDRTDGALAGAPPESAEKPAERPQPARPEVKPTKVKPSRTGGLGRLRDWFNGASTDSKGKTTPKSKPDRPRTALTRLVETGWTRIARVTEHVNVPVARTMAWQAPYVGVVADDVIKGTPLDKVLQPIARAETALSGAGSMIAMPIVVGMITSERNDPAKYGLPAAARQQALHAVLEECIDAQLEMFGSRDLAAKIARSAAEQGKRREDIGAIMAMIFAPIPAEVTVPDNATDAQVQAAQATAQRNAEAELALREAAAAVKFMPPPGPDDRGRDAERAAASMAESAARAAEAEAAAIAAARL